MSRRRFGARTAVLAACCAVMGAAVSAAGDPAAHAAVRGSHAASTAHSTTAAANTTTAAPVTPTAQAASPGTPARPQLQVTAAALYAPQTGQMLFAVNPNDREAIASTTKLMTALVTLQHVHHLSLTFAQNDWYPAAEDSQIGLVPGERMSVHDLMLAMMLPSADDAAEDLAYNVGGGSVARFVAMMNAEARELGLTNTHYSTPSGLDTPGNYSSAADLVKLADYDLTHSRYFARIVDLRRAVLRAGDDVLNVTNRNDLLGAYPWIDGVKTGHTADAGYVLVASGQRGGMRLISAVLGTVSEQQRDANTLALLNYGFDDFSLRTPVRAGQVLGDPTVIDQPGLHVPVVAESSFSRIFPRDADVHVSVQVPRQLTAPLPAQAIVGSATVLEGRHVVTRIPLLSTRRLVPVSSLTLAARFVMRPVPLLLIAAGIGLGGVLIKGTKRRRGIVRKRGLDAA